MYNVGDKVKIEGEVVQVDHLEGDDYNLLLQTANGTELWVREAHVSANKAPRRSAPVLKDGAKE